MLHTWSNIWSDVTLMSLRGQKTRLLEWARQRPQGDPNNSKAVNTLPSGLGIQIVNPQEKQDAQRCIFLLESVQLLIFGKNLENIKDLLIRFYVCFKGGLSPWYQ